MFKSKVTAAVLVGAFFCIAGRAHAQTFKPGDRVYASSTYSPGGWTSGCRIVSGPEANNAYSVTCGSDSFRTQPPWIRAVAEGPPAPVADPMRPGQMIVMPGFASAAPAATRRSVPAPVQTATGVRLGSYARPSASGSSGPGHYADDMARRLAQDAAAAHPASLRTGTYACYSGPPLRYTFTDIIINSATSYSDARGHAGRYRYTPSTGELTFGSGPYAGSYSKMVDVTTIGLSANGTTSLGTQCGLKQ